jgi:hypothetical protein
LSDNPIVKRVSRTTAPDQDGQPAAKVGRPNHIKHQQEHATHDAVEPDQISRKKRLYGGELNEGITDCSA